MSIPISTGSGAASVAAQEVGGLQYQQIEVLGPGGSSVLSIDATGAAKVTTGNSSIIAIWQSSSIIGVVTGSIIAIPTGNQSVSGTVGASVIGLTPIAISGVPSVVSFLPSVVGAISTEVADSASRLANNSAGSLVVPTFPFVFNGTNWNKSTGNSSVGTIVSFGVRNDTMSSIYSTDGAAYRAAFGPAGEQITANAPLTKWIQGTADMRGGAAASGGSVAVVAAQGASIFSYITGVQVANMGPSSVLVTLFGGTSSIVGYTVAPVGGGSNVIYRNALKTNANAAFSASVSGLSSVLVSAQGFIAKI